MENRLLFAQREHSARCAPSGAGATQLLLDGSVLLLGKAFGTAFGGCSLGSNAYRTIQVRVASGSKSAVDRYRQRPHKPVRTSPGEMSLTCAWRRGCVSSGGGVAQPGNCLRTVWGPGHPRPPPAPPFPLCPPLPPGVGIGATMAVLTTFVSFLFKNFIVPHPLALNLPTVYTLPMGCLVLLTRSGSSAGTPGRSERQTLPVSIRGYIELVPLPLTGPWGMPLH